MGVKLEFKELLAAFRAKISSDASEALLGLKEGLLKDKNISQFCEILTDHEKNRLLNLIKTYQTAQKATLDQRLKKLDRELEKLSSQNQNSLLKLKEQNALQDEICSLLGELENV